jgi:L1 cell adhesion molecule like protein
MSQLPAVGIDLGTTFSCIAIWKNHQPYVIPNENGSRITPSMVSFTKKDRLVGDAAKNNSSKNAENTVYDAKRLIGRKFNDKEVQEDIKRWPFKVKKDLNSDRPIIEVTYQNKKKEYYAEEISAIILTKIKNYAKDHLGEEIKEAVITCPAYFNDAQRNATKNAAKIAGLDVIRIINEPTAAALAYGYNKMGDNKDKKDELNLEQEKVLVFDLGGGTFDVTVLSLNSNLLEVQSSYGDMHLGGEDFDNKILDYCIKEFKELNDIDISKNQKAIRRLKGLCEKAKVNLSSMQETTIDIDSLAEGVDFNLTITRPEFEDLCKEDFNRCIPIVERALKEAKLTKEEINKVVLVGGSTRIPKIQQLVIDFFQDESKICKSLHADEAVAAGAAIVGAIATNFEEISLERLTLIDVTPLSLGLRLNNGEMAVIIEKNSPIPCEKSDTFVTAKDNQKNARVKVYQGEYKYADKNHLVGEILINDLPPLPKRQVQITVTYKINIDGILNVSVKEKSGGKISNKEFNMSNNDLNEKIIEKLIKDAEEAEKEDLKRIEAIKMKNKAQEIAIKLKSHSDKEKQKKGNEIYNFLKKNTDEDFEVYEKYYNELIQLNK